MILISKHNNALLMYFIRIDETMNNTFYCVKCYLLTYCSPTTSCGSHVSVCMMSVGSPSKEGIFPLSHVTTHFIFSAQTFHPHVLDHSTAFQNSLSHLSHTDTHVDARTHAPLSHRASFPGVGVNVVRRGEAQSSWSLMRNIKRESLRTGGWNQNHND